MANGVAGGLRLEIQGSARLRDGSRLSAAKESSRGRNSLQANAHLQANSQEKTASQRQTGVHRRAFLTATAFAAQAALAASLLAKADVIPAKVDLSAAPKSAFDPTDQRLLDAAQLFEQALTASTVRPCWWHSRLLNATPIHTNCKSQPCRRQWTHVLGSIWMTSVLHGLMKCYGCPVFHAVFLASNNARP